MASGVSLRLSADLEKLLIDALGNPIEMLTDPATGKSHPIEGSEIWKILQRNPQYEAFYDNPKGMKCKVIWASPISRKEAAAFRMSTKTDEFKANFVANAEREKAELLKKLADVRARKAAALGQSEAKSHEAKSPEAKSSVAK